MDGESTIQAQEAVRKNILDPVVLRKLGLRYLEDANCDHLFALGGIGEQLARQPKEVIENFLYPLGFGSGRGKDDPRINLGCRTKAYVSGLEYLAVDRLDTLLDAVLPPEVIGLEIRSDGRDEEKLLRVAKNDWGKGIRLLALSSFYYKEAELEELFKTELCRQLQVLVFTNAVGRPKNLRWLTESPTSQSLRVLRLFGIGVPVLKELLTKEPWPCLEGLDCPNDPDVEDKFRTSSWGQNLLVLKLSA